MRPSRPLLTRSVVACAALLASAPALSAAWTLHDAVEAPAWLILSGDHTMRYEALDHPFRAGRAGSDQILLHTTALRLGVKQDGWTAYIEGLDARQSLADSGTPVTTSMVNTLDLAQAYVSFDLGEALGTKTQTTLLVGRETMDLGSRRLVARPRFRNTMNSFDAVDLAWKHPGGSVRAFYTHPVQRTPNSATALLDNEWDLDESTGNQQFYGVYTEWTKLPVPGLLEAYAYGLQEDDSALRPTANRDLQTFGLRYQRKPAKNALDYEAELVFQTGESRSSTAANNVKDLDHEAWMLHLGLGYSFDHAWKPRLAVEYDYATGDSDPTDGKNERFDPLFGVTRGDFNPTSLYAANARANLNTPSLRLTAKPTKAVDVMLGLREIWLAEAKDSWAGLRDTTGQSGDHVGTQVETRVRWDVIPGNLSLEVGNAWLSSGEFRKNAPNAPEAADVFYGYASATLKW